MFRALGTSGYCQDLGVSRDAAPGQARPHFHQTCSVTWGRRVSWNGVPSGPLELPGHRTALGSQAAGCGVGSSGSPAVDRGLVTCSGRRPSAALSAGGLWQPSAPVQRVLRVVPALGPGWPPACGHAELCRLGPRFPCGAGSGVTPPAVLTAPRPGTQVPSLAVKSCSSLLLCTLVAAGGPGQGPGPPCGSALGVPPMPRWRGLLRGLPACTLLPSVRVAPQIR